MDILAASYLIALVVTFAASLLMKLADGVKPIWPTAQETAKILTVAVGLGTLILLMIPAVH